MGKAGRAVLSRKMGGGRILEPKQKLFSVGIAVLASGVVSGLFYDSAWGMCSLPAACYLTDVFFKRVQKNKKEKQLGLEFKDYLYAVSRLLLASYSVERAFLEGFWEIKQLHGESCMLAVRLGKMEKRLRVQEPMEHILIDFAAESKHEDIESFVEIFCYAKRGGGDFIHIMTTAAGRICDKIEVVEEIRTVMAEKALEQKIMCVAPLGILCFFRLTSPEFIGRLYGNLPGVLVMTAALALYGAAFFLGMKIVEIEV